MKATLPIPTVTQSFILTRPKNGSNLCRAGDFFLCVKALDFFPKVDRTETLFSFEISNRRFKGAKKFVLKKENTNFHIPDFQWDEDKDSTYHGIFFSNFEKTLAEITEFEKRPENGYDYFVTVYVSIENVTASE